jgi:hypothetical protein
MSETCWTCGCAYRYEVGLVSASWNNVMRVGGRGDNVCISCIIEAYAQDGVSFTAELSGGGLGGVKLDVRLNGKLSRDVELLRAENNRLRRALIEIWQGAENPVGVAEAAHSAACNPSEEVQRIIHSE